MHHHPSAQTERQGMIEPETTCLPQDFTGSCSVGFPRTFRRRIRIRMTSSVACLHSEDARFLKKQDSSRRNFSEARQERPISDKLSGSNDQIAKKSKKHPKWCPENR
jgi:hypothetical protein